MAFVKELIREQGGTVRVQPTQVVCSYKVAQHGSSRIIQIDTRGSESRELPGKVSQTLQFDDLRARQLWELLSKEFGFR
jgi:hypothetical protein